MRIDNFTPYTYYNNRQYPGRPGMDNNNPAQDRETEKIEQQERIQKQQGIKECKTCQERKYQDRSDDPGVSFKAASHLSPESARTAVVAHEYEHVRNEQVDAKKNGREVVFQNVQIYTSTCPECGRVYVSGGKTTTATKQEKQPEQYMPGLFIDQYV